MGKLTFKGDKPKRNKQKAQQQHQQLPKATSSSTFPTPVNDNKIPDGVQSVEKGWSSTQVLQDLKGPSIILSQPDNPIALLYDDITNGLKPSSNISTLPDDQVINFFQNKYSDIHKVEPNEVSQIFKFIPIDDSIGKSLINKKVVNTFAIKLNNNQYISYKNSSLGLSFTISENEIFELSPINKPDGDVSWLIIIKKHKLSLSNNKYSFVPISDQDAEGSQFIIRVHTTNTIEGSKLKLKLIESESGNVNSQNLKKTVRLLYKETKGKIKITQDLIKRLKHAENTGNLNEVVILEKSKYLSRW